MDVTQLLVKKNRLIVGLLTVLLVSGTVAVAGSVERADGGNGGSTPERASVSGDLGGGAAAGDGATTGTPADASAMPASSPIGVGTSFPSGSDYLDSGSGMTPASPAITDEVPSGGDGPSADGDGAAPMDAAVLTPLLRAAAFGTTFAVQGVGCNLGGSLLATVANELGLADLTAPLVRQGVSVCLELAANAIVVLEQLKELSSGLAAVNPVVDPLLELLAANVEILGTRYADQLAPFGGTLATLAPTIRFFIGDKGGQGAGEGQQEEEQQQ